MSDWLEGQLTQHLRPVAAPAELGQRLGFAPRKRGQGPRMLVAMAAAVVMMAGGLAANREAPGDEAVRFEAADRGAISVRLGHSANSGTAVVQQSADCRACHSL
ncbi:MAG: hypothetical protein JWP63_6393 [Candidatus Solibacter sp.]|jgi:hypothetical protein|nr:hypothetical protein [Candidatus Solibacter sp.]